MTSTPTITASSIAASSTTTTIAPGGGSTSVNVGGGAGASKTGSKVHHGGAVGMRYKIFWWELVGFVGFWMMVVV